MAIDVENPGAFSTRLKSALKSNILPLVKAEVGLANVDNTPDNSKPLSTVAIAALNLKEDALPTGFSSSDFLGGDKQFRPLTKASVGLGSVDNTPDTEKPVSAPMLAALNTKVGASSPVFTGQPTAPTPPNGNNSTRIATTAFVNIALDALVAGAPGLLNTLDEIAAALGDDPNFAASMTTLLTQKLAKTANLADLTDIPEARDNLGLGTAATAASSAFATAAQGTKADTAIQSIVEGPNITIDNTDPRNPIISSTGGGGGGSGDVTGPVSSVLNRIVTFADTSGKNIKDSGVTIADFAAASHTHDDRYYTETEVDGFITTINGSIATKAPIASPTFTGTPAAPTATSGTNTTQLATTAFVATAIANLINSAPGVLDTLDEIAAALGDDPNFAATIATSLALKAPLASPTFTGTVSGITKTMVGLGNVDNTSDLGKPISTATQSALDAKQTSIDNLTTTVSTKSAITRTIYTRTSNTTTSLQEAGNIVEMNVNSANTYTIAPNGTITHAVGTQIEIVQIGSGQTALVAGAGVTILSYNGNLKIAGQYAAVTIYQRATNVWVATGMLVA